MFIDSSLIGIKSDVEVFEIEKGAIRNFARVIGDDNPLYFDEAYAKENGYSSIVAPPTFVTSLRLEKTNMPRFDLLRTLNGGQEYVYERPVVAGDVLRCMREIVDVYDKQGRSGPMTCIIIEDRGEDLDGNLVFRGRNTIILLRMEESQ